MITYAFKIRKWPKRHEHLVENCQELDVSQLLGLIPFYNTENFIAWSPPTHPLLKLVPARGGFCVKLWLQCPSCYGRFGALYIPPNGDPGSWKCRKCCGAIYSSQRHGPRHPSRKILTPLKRSRRRKEAIRQNRKFARQKAKQEKLRQNQEEPILDQTFIPMMMEMDKFIALGGSITLKVESRNFDGSVNPHQGEIESMLDDAALEAKSILENLAVNGKTRSIRAEARRTLDRGNKMRTIPDKGLQKSEKPCPPSISFSAAELDRIKAVMSEVGLKP